MSTQHSDRFNTPETALIVQKFINVHSLTLKLGFGAGILASRLIVLEMDNIWSDLLVTEILVILFVSKNGLEVLF